MKKEAALTDQVKSKKKSKVTKRDVSEPFTWKVLNESDGKDVDRLIALYKEDKRSAKVLYKESTGLYRKQSIVLYEHANGDINVVYYLKSYGIGRTGIMYNTTKNVSSIIYIKKTNCFWHRSAGGKVLNQLTYYSLKHFSRQVRIQRLLGERKLEVIDIKDYFLEKFTWLRNISIDERLHHTSFNVLLKNKLFNLVDVLKYKYKVNGPTALLLGEIGGLGEEDNGEGSFHTKEWNRMRHMLTNPEHISREFMDNKYLHDMLNMGDSLGYKINPKWSEKRMELEHDNWSKEISEILISHQPLMELKISKIFHEFQAFSGYEMLKTNHELTREGKKMKHCVGTYSDSVNKGGSCIYHVHGCTLELRYDKSIYGEEKKLAEELGVDKILYIGQYQDYGNKLPKKEIYKLIEDKVEEFNRTALYKGKPDSFELKLDINGDIELIEPVVKQIINVDENGDEDENW